jgi:hypothetical protein
MRHERNAALPVDIEKQLHQRIARLYQVVFGRTKN